MRNQWLPAVLLLCPAFAGARSPGYYEDYDDFDSHRPWLGVGLGNGAVESQAPAPAAGLNAFGGSIDAGYRITPEWGLGLEFSVIAPRGGCGGHHCSSVLPDFAPDFTHWFLLGEYRPGGGGGGDGDGSGWRLRAGAGVSSMCYRYYRHEALTWESVVVAILFDDQDAGSLETRAWGCKRLSTFGASASIGYQWRVGKEVPASVGLQLRGEMADFAASSNATTPAFRHRALIMQMQFALD